MSREDVGHFVPENAAQLVAVELGRQRGVDHHEGGVQADGHGVEVRVAHEVEVGPLGEVEHLAGLAQEPVEIG